MITKTASGFIDRPAVQTMIRSADEVIELAIRQRALNKQKAEDEKRINEIMNKSSLVKKSSWGMVGTALKTVVKPFGWAAKKAGGALIRAAGGSNPFSVKPMTLSQKAFGAAGTAAMGHEAITNYNNTMGMMYPRQPMMPKMASSLEKVKKKLPEDYHIKTKVWE